MFGGLASLNGQPAEPSSEFKIAVVGPAASFLLGIVFFLADELLLYGTPHRGIGQVLRHVGNINLLLAGFNMLPGMPLDGGRVLRALIWRYNKNFRSATQVAVRAGLMIAITLILMGILYFHSVDWVMGVWMMTIGLIVALMLGTTEGRNYGVWRVKRGTVEDVMNRDVVQVPPEMIISDFIKKVLENNHDTAFPIVRDRRLHGMLFLEDLKRLPREAWPTLEVREVMRPVDNLMFINSSATIPQAQAMLASNGLGRAVIIDSNGWIIGHVGLSDIKASHRQADASRA